MRHSYDGHNGGHCSDCGNALTQGDCDAWSLGLYDRVLSM
jgi:hypothetical protein